MTSAPTNPAQRFAAAWCALEAELDWVLLGRAHCSEGGDEFFDDEARAQLFETGLLFADDLAAVLAPGGRSLYVGASVAELPVILCEHFVLGREVLWHDLPGPITDEVNRALASTAPDPSLPRVRTDPLTVVALASCDHAWLVSVLTDPDAFPALHDALYERTGEHATARGDLDDDRARAAALIDQVLDRLQLPATLTTTTEELELVAPAIEARGWQLGLPDLARLSAVVGDEVRVCTVTNA